MTSFPSLAGHGAIGVDIETFEPKSLKKYGPGTYRGGYIAGVAIATQRGFKAYYPVAHEAGPNLPREKVFGWLKKELSRPKQPKRGANLLYDMGYLKEVGVDLVGPIEDVQVAEPLLDENRLSYSLDMIARDRVGRQKNDDQMVDFLKRHFGKKDAKANIWRAPPDVVAPYAIEDAQLAVDVFDVQKKLLEDQGLWPLFQLEASLMPMLLAMRKRGVRIDVPRVEQQLHDLGKKQTAAEKRVKRLTGVDLECWNAASIARIFDELGLGYPRTPKTKAPSFTAGFLNSHPSEVAKLILEVRRYDKLRGTFLQGQLLDNSVDGRVHCQFNQLKSDDHGTISGRFSSSNPNLQFIPVRTEEGNAIRRAFLPEPGCEWAKLDWSQIEYRLITVDAYDLGLRGASEVIDRYQDPEADYHQIIADMTNLPRSQAKTINFGIAYGEGVPKLAGQLGLTLDEADVLMSQYHRNAPFVKPLLRHYMHLAEITGEIQTLYGRRRRFSRWVTRIKGEQIFTDHRINGASRRVGVHAALNARIQGSAADVMKKAMVDIWQGGTVAVLGAPHLTVHDELDYSVPKTKIGCEAIAEVKNIMESVVRMPVPLLADMKTGPNWGDCV